jgi:small subunit ribosomal protein S16
MPVKIRLARHGRKAAPFYYIVATDSRAPRDGKYIERIGSYNPNTDPATINLDFEKALSWLQKGAQPTDTCKAVLSYKGVIYKNHLLKGVAKGALTVEQAEVKFEAWLKEKEAKILAKKERINTKAKTERTKKVEAEKLVSQAREEAVAKKNAKAAQAEKSSEEAENSDENSAE